MIPANVPGDFPVHFRTIQQRVDYVVVVVHVNVACLKGCRPGGEINRDCVFGNRDRPKQTAFGRPRIEIVNLLTRRVKYVKSYERKRAVVIATVRADVFSRHEAHIGFKVQVLRRFTNYGVGAHTAHGCPANEAIEVGDR